MVGRMFIDGGWIGDSWRRNEGAPGLQHEGVRRWGGKRQSAGEMGGGGLCSVLWSGGLGTEIARAAIAVSLGDREIP